MVKRATRTKAAPKKSSKKRKGSGFKPSKFQKAIFAFVKSGHGNAIIQAVAGSGKTTTIVEALKFTKGTVLFCAFNKAIVKELETKVPKHVEVKTLHSIGYGIIRRNIGRGKRISVDNDKVRKIVRELLTDDPNAWGHGYSPRSTEGLVCKLVNLCQACLLTGEVEDVLWIADRYDVPLNSASVFDLSRWIKGTLSRSSKLAEHGVIDYNDMIYLPALQLGKGWSGFRHQWIFVDEAQDLSKAQRIILQNLLAKGGRLVAVGDEKQAIYGFRGADADSMRLLKEHFACKELPLSICYRCPKSHVDLAKELVPQIEAAKTAKEGTVTGMKYDMLPTIAQEGDLVMCRRNAPLVKAALTVIASGKKAKVKGRDIGKGLSKLVQKMNCSYTDELLVKLNAYVDREVMRLRQADKESQAESLCDRRDCIEIIAEGTQTSRELTEKVERIFADKADGVIFSSVHRAKGLEAERAFVLEYDTLPFTWRKQREWQYQQELNIKYVALTRSKSALFLVDKEESK